MPLVKTEKAFLDWLQLPNESVKKDYYLSKYYDVGTGMLHLNNLKLKNLVLTDKNFGSTEFKNCLFEECEFTSSVIASCTLIDCEFRYCEFLGTEFLESDFINTKFNQCNITAVDAADLVCKNLQFENCNEIVDLRLRGTFAEREISFKNCYIEFLIIEPIEKEYSEIINFTDCIIQESSFDRIDMSKSKISKCSLSLNRFSNCILSIDTLIELNETPAQEYNFIDLRTILNSDNQSSAVLENIFGIQNTDIKDYIYGLTSKIEFQSVFISYSFKDKHFATRINNELLRKGIITSLWEKDSPGGKTLKEIMSEGVNRNDRVLFIASKESLKSAACQFELSEGRRKQEKIWENVLFPIHIDDYLFNIKKESIRPIEVQEEYWKNILELRNLNSLDFSPFYDQNYSDKNAFENLVFRLVKGLRKVK